MFTVPFHKPTFVGTELDFIREAIQQGAWAGNGPFSQKCERLLEETLGVKRALLTPSATHALEMAALLLNLGPGDEVIVPSFTFVSTVNAFVLRGARPVFIDIRPDTLNLDETLLEGLITERTKAIFLVHYAGVACEMETIMDIAAKYGIPIVEDNAHGLFGAYKGRPLGTFGHLAVQSFHATKNFTCGEGGALLINDPALIERAEILREKGTNRSQFFRGEVDKYTWVDIGSSYLLSDLAAAFLYAQLQAREKIQAARKRLWWRYYEALQPWAREQQVQLPYVPEGVDPAYHLLFVLFPTLEARQTAMDFLKAQGIQATFHYVPLHTSPMGIKWGGYPGQCPVTEEVSERLLRLPFYTAMTDEEQDRVIRILTQLKVSSSDN